MKKIIVQSFVALSVLFIMFTSVQALTIVERPTVDSSLYTGTYLFTVTDPANDNPQQFSATELNDLLDAINGKIAPDSIGNFEQYSKVDAPSLGGTPLSISYDAGNKTGTWESDVAVQFYTVKAATEWALYWLGLDGLFSGDWSTQHLLTPNLNNQPDISHLTVWNTTTAQVPEPSTLLLFGAGIAGLALYRRKRS